MAKWLKWVDRLLELEWEWNHNFHGIVLQLYWGIFVPDALDAKIRQIFILWSRSPAVTCVAFAWFLIVHLVALFLSLFDIAALGYIFKVAVYTTKLLVAEFFDLNHCYLALALTFHCKDIYNYIGRRTNGDISWVTNASFLISRGQNGHSTLHCNLPWIYHLLHFPIFHKVARKMAPLAKL